MAGTYSARQPKVSTSSIKAELLLRSANSSLGPDVENLTLDVVYETVQRLHVTIGDQARERWRIPEEIVAVDRPRKEAEPEDCDYEFQYTTEPFGFSVVRKEDGERLFDTLGSELIFKDQYLEISSVIPQEANIYGLGEHVGSFRRKTEGEGSRITIWARDALTPQEENLYGAHPFYMEVRNGKAHGVLLLNSNGMDIILKSDRLTYKIIGGIFDFYFFTGPTPASVVQQYLDLIGYPTMPAFWTLGQHQCRWGYHSLDMFRDMIEGYKKAKIPLDGLWMDIDYMDNFKLFTHNEERFPLIQWQALIKEAREKNHQHLIAIIDPGVKIEEGYTAYEDGLKRDIFIKYMDEDGKIHNSIGVVWPGKVHFLDWFSPEASKYWTEHLTKFCETYMVDGVWIDMNEVANPFMDSGIVSQQQDVPPSEKIRANNAAQLLLPKQVKVDVCNPLLTPRGPFSVLNPPYNINNGKKELPLNHKTIAMDSIHYNGRYEYDVHSLYGHMESEATYRALKAMRPDEKPFVLTRSSFVGTGRFAAHWLGDNWSFFNYLENSISGILSFQLYGIPQVGADIGGFSRNATENLMIRWTELGAFYPFCRNHNSLGNMAQEPYLWESVAHVARKYLKIRYSLLPYWYTLFYRASTRGTTVLEPMFFVFPNDQETYPIDRQFLVGNGLLVSPAVQENQTHVSAYLPPEGQWYEFPTGLRVRQTGWIKLDAPMDHIPLHVRGGVIIPMYTNPHMTTFETKRMSDVKLLIALDTNGEAEGELYVDDDTPLPARSSILAIFKIVEGRKLVVHKLLNVGIQQKIVVGEVCIFGLKSKTHKSVKIVNGVEQKEVCGIWDYTNEVFTIEGLKEPIKESWELIW